MNDDKLKVLRVLWVALLGSPALFLFVGYMVVTERQEALTPDPILLPVLGATAIGSAMASVLLPRVLLRPALLGLGLPLTDAPSPGPSRGRRRARRFADSGNARSRLLATVQTYFILGMALAESVALQGFVLWFLGFPFIYVAPFFVVSWALMLVKFPRRPQFELELESAYDADLD